MKKVLFAVLAILYTSSTIAQDRRFNFEVTALTSFTSSDQVPFWLRSNRFGSVPPSGLSGGAIASLNKAYDTTSKKLFDWGAGIEARANLGKQTDLSLIEGYAKGRVGIFELKAGRTKDISGLTDTLLSSGNFAISGNALGIPKVQISIPDFYAVPIFGRIFAFKGAFAHGWLGNVDIQNKRVSSAITYFHQKSFHVRLGMHNWRTKLYAGFSDQVFWGHEAEIFESFVLTWWQKYQSVVLGRNWAFSKVGNHVGNIDLRIDHNLDNVRISLYRQNFYEVGALYHLANVADAITGVSIVNKAQGSRRINFNRLVFEYIYTKNQAGETWSKPTPSGDENYHNHYLYAKGWSYKGINLGTPLITPVPFAREGLPSRPYNYFINNRVSAFHFGSHLSVYDFDVKTKLTYSRNFGTHPTKRTFPPLSQFSGLAEISKSLGMGYNIGGLIALDIGKLFYNSTGLMIMASKKF